MATVTARQRAWIDAAAHSDEVAAGLFALIALPNEQERGHSCREHACGFRTAEGRRGFRCGICREIVKWVDEEVA